jgi:amidohydrolase
MTEVQEKLKQKVQELANSFSGDAVRIRRHMHQFPELSFEEFKTSAFIKSELEAIGIADIKSCAGTGWLAIIEGRNPSSGVLALRADMDALPITETNEVDYKSQNEGVMHACGHDVHTASLLGTARILFELREHFEGTVKLIFQPGEEKLPGGASKMIAEGALQSPEVNNIIGQHVMPLIPAGKVGFRQGLYMASADEIYIDIHGKGGHGAHPHQNIDPVAIGAQMLVALHQIVSRTAKPAIPSVLSFGKVEAKGATNVIPDTMHLEGTFRTFDEDWRMAAHQKIKKVATGICEAMGATCDIDIKLGYPCLTNDDDLTQKSRSYAENYLGKENVEDLEIWPAGEDFAFFSQEIPACFYRLGTRNEAKGITSMVHTPTFDVDEKALETGTGLMAWIALSELNSLTS